MAVIDDGKNFMLLLAAGGASRMGRPKQLLNWKGRPLLEHTLNLCLNSPADYTVLVLGAHREHIFEAVPQLNDADSGCFCTAVNEGWEEGMSSSLKIGVRRVLEVCSEKGWKPKTISFCPADLPFLNSGVFSLIYEKIKNTDNAENKIFIPCFKGRRGHPAAFGFRYADDLLNLSGDCGASSVIKRYRDSIIFAEAEDCGIYCDCDNISDYERFSRASYPDEFAEFNGPEIQKV